MPHFLTFFIMAWHDEITLLVYTPEAKNYMWPMAKKMSSCPNISMQVIQVDY
jgi:hypothetical protein